MPSTLHTNEHKILVDLLIEARKEAQLNQTQVGERFGRDQKFVSLVEKSQRRLDVLEFYSYCKAMNHDPVKLFEALADKLSGTKPK